AFEFLDSPGEWYLSSGTGQLFYMSRADEDMSKTQAVGPVLGTLVQIGGTRDAPGHHLQFQGPTFAHSNWMLPSTQGFVLSQAVEFLGGVMPPAISVQNAEHLRFERNIFEQLGGHGLAF